MNGKTLFKEEWMKPIDWTTMHGKKLSAEVVKSEGQTVVILFEQDTDKYYFVHYEEDDLCQN